MISSVPLPAALYNALPEPQEQPFPSMEALDCLGALFIKHRTNDRFGLALVHRHYRLEDGEAMVHRGLVCAPEIPEHVTGRSFLLKDGEFRAYEYEAGEGLALPSEDFLRDLKSELLSAGLDQSLSLARLDYDHSLLVESCEAGRSHVCESVREDQLDAYIPVGGSLMDTEWRFERHDYGTKAHARKKYFNEPVYMGHGIVESGFWTESATKCPCNPEYGRRSADGQGKVGYGVRTVAAKKCPANGQWGYHSKLGG